MAPEGTAQQLTLFETRAPVRAEAASAELPREVLFQQAEALALQLSRLLAEPVRLSVTDNRSTMISFKRVERVVHVRVHRLFLDAPVPVVEALAQYTRRPGKGTAGLLDSYVEERRGVIRTRRTAGSAASSRGRCFDLKVIFDAVNARHFDGAIVAAIYWGRVPPRRGRRSVRLGVYDHHAREIRIHPLLDDPRVPAFFVEFVVFHEMLHQLFPARSGGARNIHHPKDFRERERSFSHYAAALAWERQHLAELLGRRGR